MTDRECGPVIDYAQAMQQVMDAALPLPAETVAIDAAVGRVLAGAVHSTQCLPPFDNAAMDGFVLATQGGPFATGHEFEVSGWRAAGDAADVGAGRLASERACEIMTGAMVPDGMDAVVPVEHVRILHEDEQGRPRRIRLLQVVRPGQHVRLRGEDVELGQAVLEAGRSIGGNEYTLLHALGITEVTVRVQPRVAVICTGKELQDPTQALAAGQIRDSNRPYLVGRLRAAGAEVVWQGTVGDDVAVFGAALAQALDAGAQVIVSTGAVSQGRYDFIPEALRALGAHVGFHKVAIRPGKPVLFAQLADGAAYFGLPGNPLAAAAGQRFFVEPLLRHALGMPAEQPLWLPLAGGYRKSAGCRFHGCARVGCDAQGRLQVSLLPGQQSFRLMSLVGANAWAALPEECTDAGEGSAVMVYGWGHRDPVQVSAAPFE